jgi:pyrimidine-specific ribonucleoside hydrolase
MNPNTVAEWNLYIDPVAGDLVFRSGVILFLAPLDVTHTKGAHPLLLQPAFLEAFSTYASGRELKMMAGIMQGWQLLQDPSQPTLGMPLWDLAAAVIEVEPDACTVWRDFSLRVVLSPDTVAGQTIADKENGNKAHVCLAGDISVFEKALLKNEKEDVQAP